MRVPAVAKRLPVPMKRFLYAAATRPRFWIRRGTASLRGLPSFMIIGTQKGGTTSLYRYLAQSPGFLPPFAKEMNYFAQEYERGENWYRGHFPLKWRLKRRITGEASTNYLWHPEAAERIRKDLPDTKIIIMLRDPVDRAWSHYWHECRQDIPRESLSFEEAIEREEERLAKEDEELQNPFNGWHHQHHSYVKRGFYDEQVKRYLDLFPREQILILKSEEFYENPKEGTVKAAKFLGLPTENLEDSSVYKVYNKGSYREIPKKVKEELKDIFKPHVEILEQMTKMTFGWLKD